MHRDCLQLIYIVNEIYKYIVRCRYEVVLLKLFRQNAYVHDRAVSLQGC